MASSFEGINYSLRPAKQIERKMICEAIRRLAVFGSIEAYRYIGFGSIYFSDFSLFHKRLNISNMLSIEKESNKQARFEFNKPFDCIDLQFEESNVVLPKLDWTTRTILWLDYDGKLDGGVLSDVASFCANAVSGSMLIVSLNSHTDPNESDRLGSLKASLGSDLVPIDAVECDLAGWKMSVMVRRILSNWIAKTLGDRNGARNRGARFNWQQVMSFEYQDGAKMTTLGGVLIDDGHQSQFSACNFDNLEFVKRSPEDAYRIDVPALTFRELRALDQLLPDVDGNQAKLPAIPTKDLKNYAALYRYFPNFAESDF